MALANYLADIWGISLVLIPLSLLINEKHLKKIFSDIENESEAFFWIHGIASLLIGLAMVLSFNVWEQSWQVIITVLGWLALLKGLIVLFMPTQAKKCVKMMENQKWLPYALVVVVIIGLAITYCGFTV